MVNIFAASMLKVQYMVCSPGLFLVYYILSKICFTGGIKSNIIVFNP